MMRTTPAVARPVKEMLSIDDMALYARILRTRTACKFLVLLPATACSAPRSAHD